MLASPAGLANRPTQERVREALFSRLGSRVDGALVVDLYAGSGALGLEALSRGARAAVFVERAPAALESLRANVRALAAEAWVRIVAGDVADFVRGRFGPLQGVDILLADPPYGTVTASFLAGIADSAAIGWVERALIALETSKRDAPPEPAAGWRRWPERVYGETRLLVDEREARGAQAPGRNGAE